MCAIFFCFARLSAHFLYVRSCVCAITRTRLTCMYLPDPMSDVVVLDFISLQGEDSVEYFLGLTPSGIVVLRDKTTVAYYYWPRITKVYFKGRYFMLRVCDKNVSYFFLSLFLSLALFCSFCVFVCARALRCVVYVQKANKSF